MSPVKIMNRLLRVALAVTIFLAVPIAASQDRGATAGLTFSQIEQLVVNHIPDATVAREIQRRGVSFGLTAGLIEKLRKTGAGPKTLHALHQLLPLAALEVSTTPADSEVWVDGTLRGHSDTEGKLLLADLKPGAHGVLVKKQGYEDSVSAVSLNAESRQQLSVVLVWSGGYLTVLTGAQDVSVDIDRMGHFSGPVTKMPCLPGDYQITVSGTRYLAATKTATVIAGQETTTSFSLQPDPGFLRAAVSDIQSAFEARRYADTLQLAQEVLALDPFNKDALSYLASSYFMTDDYERFVPTANQALGAGGTVQVFVKHHHAGLVHPAVLLISTQAIAMVPQGDVRCKGFNSPASTIAHVEVTRNPNNEIYLNLKLRDPKNQNRTYNYNFAEREANLVAAQKGAGGFIVYTGHLLQSRAEAQQALSALASLLKRIAPGS